MSESASSHLKCNRCKNATMSFLALAYDRRVGERSRCSRAYCGRRGTVIAAQRLPAFAPVQIAHQGAAVDRDTRIPPVRNTRRI
jgi:hypothetical protein